MIERQGRQSWLDAGFAQLAAQGPEGLRIMTIARQLGVTKGSFYWHFRDQGEYLAALLDEWERSHTQHIIDQVERAGGDAAAKLRTLLQVTFAADLRLSGAIRTWGHTDPVAGKALKRVDKKRLAYVAGLIQALGWPREDAATLARWAYCALIGHFHLQGPALSEAQIELVLGTIMPRTARD